MEKRTGAFSGPIKPSSNATASLLKPLALAVLLPLVFTGCVTRSSYEKGIDEMERRLAAERANNLASMSVIESKLEDKNSTLKEITERYMALQKGQEESQAWINGFRSELEAISKDLSELKLVISSNTNEMKSTVANEMLIKIIDMEHRIGEMLKKGEGP